MSWKFKAGQFVGIMLGAVAGTFIVHSISNSLKKNEPKNQNLDSNYKYMAIPNSQSQRNQ